MGSSDKIRAGQGEVEIGANLSPLEQGLNSAKEKLQGWGTLVAKAGAIIGGVGIAIMSPFLYGLNSMTEIADEIGSAARQAGLPVGRMADLMAGLVMSGDEVGKVFDKMGDFMLAAAGGGAGSTLAALNLSFAELNALAPDERMLRISDALADMASRDFAQASVVGQNIFGAKTDVSRMLGGRGAIQSRIDRGHQIGSIILPEEIAAANSYIIAQGELGRVTKAAWAGIGAVAAPVLRDFIYFILPLVTGIRKLVVDMRPLLSVWFKFGFVLAKVGAVLVTVGGLIFGAGTLLGVMALSIPLIIAGVKMLGTALLVAFGVAVLLFTWVVVPGLILYGVVLGLLELFPRLGEYIGTALSAVGGYFAGWMQPLRAFGELFSNVWGGIISAIMGGELGIAFDIAVLGLRLMWMGFVNYLSDSWYAFKFMFLTVFDMLREPVRNLLIGIVASFDRVITGIYNIFVSAINALVLSTPSSVAHAVGLRQVAFRTVNDRGTVDAVNRLLGGADGAAAAAGRDFQMARAEGNEQQRILQGELDFALAEADTARLIREMEIAALAEAGRGNEGGFDQQAQGSVFGTFSADQARAFFGSDTPMNRIERLEQRQVEQNAVVIRILEDILARGGARFA